MPLTHNSKVADKEPGWAGVDKTRLPRAAFADRGDPSRASPSRASGSNDGSNDAASKSSWAYPHHWVQDGGDLDEDGCYTTGTMYLHEAG